MLNQRDDRTLSISSTPRFQFRLRTLFLALSIAAVGMAIAVHSLLLSIIAIAILVLLAQKRFGLALATVGAFLTVSCLGVGQSVQVQLDTGDQRLCFCGIPVLTHRPMHATVRKELMSLNDGRVPFGWTWCATQIGTHNADAMVYGFYCKAAAWVDVDPEIAKLALCDIAKYVQLTHARGGLPQCACLLWIVDQEDGRYKVPESWQDDAEIRQYLVSQGYVYRLSSTNRNVPLSHE